MRLAALRAPAGVRHASGLPFRIRAPAAKLLERKSRGQAPGEKAREASHGEKLETGDHGADYVRLGLTSRVYDMIQESPLQYAAGLSSRLNANLHIKREDLLPSFSFKIRGAYNLLADIESKGGRDVVTYSVGSQGHSVALAARQLGMHATIVVPERTPVVRRKTLEHKGATVIVHGKSLADSQMLAESMADENLSSLLRPHETSASSRDRCDLPLPLPPTPTPTPTPTATPPSETYPYPYPYPRPPSAPSGAQHGGVSESLPSAAAAEATRATHLDAISCRGALARGGCRGTDHAGHQAIGVEPSDSDVLNRSLLAATASPSRAGHFVDGAVAAQIAPRPSASATSWSTTSSP